MTAHIFPKDKEKSRPLQVSRPPQHSKFTGVSEPRNTKSKAKFFPLAS